MGWWEGVRGLVPLGVNWGVPGELVYTRGLTVRAEAEPLGRRRPE